MNDQELIIAASSSLEGLTGFHVTLDFRHADAKGHDLDLEIRTDTGVHHLPAEIVRSGSRTTLSRLIVHHVARAARADVVILTDYVSPKNAEILCENGLQFLDSSGNSSIQDRNLRILIEGKKRLHSDTRQPTAFQKSGLRVVFALLVNYDLRNATFREIAGYTNVSRGTVGNVLSGLEQANLLQRVGRSRRRLTKVDDLINRWVTAYAEVLRPSITRGSVNLLDSDRHAWRELDIAPEMAQWGGEPAAAILTEYLVPSELTIYSDAKLSVLAKALNLRLSKEGGVILLDRFWNPEIIPGKPGPTVHPLLVYADLIASGDPRNIEVAQMIYESDLSNLE